MAVQLNYIAPPGWQPENPDQDYLVIQFKIELADFVDKKKFADAAASVAAESSTGTWTKVDEGPQSGIKMADDMKAIVFDVDEANFMFKVAYKTVLSSYYPTYMTVKVVDPVTGQQVASTSTGSGDAFTIGRFAMPADSGATYEARISLSYYVGGTSKTITASKVLTNFTSNDQTID
ncbi:MAG: hypothetical protein UV46_C0002G0001, partial [Candidatus Gottesmanbacteria bacterium GW2011_GWC2_42_8]